MKSSNPALISVFIFLAGGLFFFPFLGSVHLFDWDEINFAECAREMIASGNYLSVTIDYLPFHEKPPLFIWLQVLSMNVFGVNEFAARFPNAICGIATLLILFHIGRKIKSTRLGLLWILVYAGSFLPHFYFKSGIIDPWFNLFIFLGIYFFIHYSYEGRIAMRREKNTYIFLSALFIGLGILTKGPVAFLIFILCAGVYWILHRFRKIISFSHLSLFAITLFIVGGSWYIFLFATNNDSMMSFIKYQFRLLTTEDSGHGGPFYYHALVLLFGCFPASVIALASFRKSLPDTSFQSHFKKWMFILFFVVLIFFSFVETKIIHYSSLCYFPLTFLAAYSMEKFISGEWKMKKWMSWLIGIIGTVLGLVFILPPIIEKHKEKIISNGIIKDVFAVENLKANVNWSGFEIIPGIIFITGIILTLVWLKRNNPKSLVFLFALSLATVSAISFIIVPKVEQYSQGAAIAFYKNLQGKDCYVETLGFKSYAHLFYSRKQPQPFVGMDSLLSGNIGKPVYFVAKINKANEVQEKYPQLFEMYRKNGFVFYVRK